MTNCIWKRVFAGWLVVVLLLASAACKDKPELADETEPDAPSPTAENTPEAAPDESDILRDLQLPPEALQTQWQFFDDDEQQTLSAHYADIGLWDTHDFLDALVQDNWLLRENSAYKGARSIAMAYDLAGRTLRLEFALLKHAPEWPEGILTPFLAYATPPFGYGTFTSAASTEFLSENATTLNYRDVSAADIISYEQQLTEAGFTFNEDRCQRYYAKGLLFTSVSYHTTTQQAMVTVGERAVQYVPLPPWPLPDHLMRILPPVAAVMTATGADDGYFVSAEQVTLVDLHGFLSASLNHYDWTRLDGDSIQHAESGFVVKLLTYVSDSGLWTITIYNSDTGDPVQTLPPQTAQPTDEIGFSEFVYRVSSEAYSDQAAMAGVLEEFGQYGTLADWSEIKALYGSDIARFLDDVGVKPGEDVWVQQGGQARDGGRHYFLARISGQPRDNFLMYDSMGDEAWLGSWYDIELRVLTKVPADQ
jgi:hypothetical protein